VSEIINWSSANKSVWKINSLKYLLVFSFCNQILITSSKYKLNKTGDSGHPCLNPWVIALESSDIDYDDDNDDCSGGGGGSCGSSSGVSNAARK